MYLINDRLAVDAIPQKKEVMLYVDAVVGNIDDFHIIDVRMLKENQPNSNEQYLLNIIRVTSWLQCNEKVVICSSAAKSRSLAIAIGVLVKYFKMNFYDAQKQVMKQIPSGKINNMHVDSLKKILNIS